MTTFDNELDALRVLYETLKPFEFQVRDRIVRTVVDRLARERDDSAVAQFRNGPRSVEHIEATLPKPFIPQPTPGRRGGDS